MTSLIPISQT